MADSIKMKLDGSQYRLPAQEDIDSAKQFVLQRNGYARILGERIDDCLAGAAEEIVAICYRYNVDPKTFEISSVYNAQMMEEIAAVMDELEEEILNLIYEYSTRVTDDRKRISALTAWLATLGRGNRNLQDTLDTYLYRTMKDWEAAIAALRAAGAEQGRATTQIKTYLHAVYTMPEVLEAFGDAQDFTAAYIRSRGVMKGGAGLSNNGSTNVVNMAKTTLQMAWMRGQGMEFKENGAAGYYQLRGSSYPCDICDAEVGFHNGVADTMENPLPHPHCMCYRVPVYKKNNQNT